MADYYNISQLIEICPGSPAQMSLSESSSPWANIPTAPSAGCVHLTRKKIWLLLSRVCYLQHRYFYCNMDCRALQRGGLLSAKSDSWHTPCAGDLAVFRNCRHSCHTEGKGYSVRSYPAPYLQHPLRSCAGGFFVLAWV